MILIRPYTLNDSATLAVVINQVCADSPFMATRSFIPTSSWIHALVIDNCQNHCLLMAKSNDEVIGWCRCFPANCNAPVPDAELGIGLITAYRNHGIGSELIMKSLEWASFVGIKLIRLTVSSQNLIATHVFEKCGFEYVKMDENNMLMSICLS